MSCTQLVLFGGSIFGLLVSIWQVVEGIFSCLIFLANCTPTGRPPPPLRTAPLAPDQLCHIFASFFVCNFIVWSVVDALPMSTAHSAHSWKLGRCWSRGKHCPRLWRKPPNFGLPRPPPPATQGGRYLTQRDCTSWTCDSYLDTSANGSLHMSIVK